MLRYPALGNKRETHFQKKENACRSIIKGQSRYRKGRKRTQTPTDLERKVSEEPGGNEKNRRAAEKLK